MALFMGLYNMLRIEPVRGKIYNTEICLNEKRYQMDGEYPVNNHTKSTYFFVQIL